MNKQVLNFFHSLHQVSHMAQQLAHRDLFADEGLTNMQFCILKEIFMEGGSIEAVNRLSVAKTCTPANLTGLIARLVKAGYITKKRHSGDQRRYQIDLTPEGDRLCQRVFAKIQDKSENMKFIESQIDVPGMTKQLDHLYSILSNQ